MERASAPAGLREVAHRVLEDAQALADFAAEIAFGAAGPVRMLRRIDEPLGVRHQAEHAAGRVADAGDVVDRAVGIVGVGDGGLTGLRLSRASRLASGLYLSTNCPCARSDSSTCSSRGTNLPSPCATGSSIASMPARKTHLLSRRRHASRTQRSSNLPRVVPRERRRGPGRVVRQQQLGLEQNLKAVADAEDQLAGVAELVERVGQVMRESGCRGSGRPRCRRRS